MNLKPRDNELKLKPISVMLRPIRVMLKLISAILNLKPKENGHRSKLISVMLNYVDVRQRWRQDGGNWIINWMQDRGNWIINWRQSKGKLNLNRGNWIINQPSSLLTRPSSNPLLINTTYPIVMVASWSGRSDHINHQQWAIRSKLQQSFPNLTLIRPVRN